MAQVLKRRRLVNAGRRRRMTAKQIRFFGTKRQKTALKNRRRNAGSFSFRKSKKSFKKARARGLGKRLHKKAYQAYLKTRRRNQGGIVSQAEHAAAQAIRSVERAAEDAIGSVSRQVNRRRNVGEILTVVPAANPGRRRRRNSTTMAATRRRRRRARLTNRRRRYNARTYNPRRRRRTANRRRRYTRHRMRNPKVIVRYRNRRRRRNYRRRNQGAMLSGNMGKVVGILGGATVTGMITGMLPANLKSGWLGYLTTGVVAVVTGNVAGRMMKNRSFGTWMTVGGFLIVGLQIAHQFFPQLALPFTAGTSGMGLITSSNFFVPQVNLPGSMASFVTPAGVTSAIPVMPATAMRGLGQGASPLIGLRTQRRMGRLR